MRSRRERVLLWLFAAVSVAAALGLSSSLLWQELDQARRRTRTYEAQLASLHRDLPAPGALREYHRELQAAVDGYSARRYAPDEMDPYRFGALVQGLLRRHGLSVERYQLGAGERADTIEFSVRGSPLGFSAFLKEISTMKEPPRIGYIQVTGHPEEGSLRSVFRIGYETTAVVDH